MNKQLVEQCVNACHRFINLADSVHATDYEMVERGLGSTATATLRRQALQLTQLLDKLRKGR